SKTQKNNPTIPATAIRTRLPVIVISLPFLLASELRNLRRQRKVFQRTGSDLHDIASLVVGREFDSFPRSCDEFNTGSRQSWSLLPPHACRGERYGRRPVGKPDFRRQGYL